MSDMNNGKNFRTALHGFNREDVVEYIESHFANEHVSFVDLKGINPVDTMYNDADAEKVIERFRQANS